MSKQVNNEFSKVNTNEMRQHLICLDWDAPFFYDVFDTETREYLPIEVPVIYYKDRLNETKIYVVGFMSGNRHNFYYGYIENEGLYRLPLHNEWGNRLYKNKFVTKNETAHIDNELYKDIIKMRKGKFKHLKDNFFQVVEKNSVQMYWTYQESVVFMEYTIELIRQMKKSKTSKKLIFKKSKNQVYFDFLHYYYKNKPHWNGNKVFNYIQFI